MEEGNWFDVPEKGAIFILESEEELFLKENPTAKKIENFNYWLEKFSNNEY